MSERRGRRRAVTPGDILEVAKRHAVAHGWRASRVQAIAAEVGVSRPTLYSAFPSKQDLGIAIIRDVNTTLLDALALSIRDARTTEEGLRRGILFALTEADSGSDAASLRTTAIRDGDHYVLNGTKRYITNAPHAGIFTLMARTNPADKGAGGVSAFILDAKSPGISLGKPDKKMGQRGAHTCDVMFDNVRVPAANLIGGREGQGFKMAMRVLDKGRIHIAAVCDADERRLAAASQLAGPQADVYRDYRYILQRKDIDAVVIATPDHWHAVQTVHAAESGKHVYVEKPACCTIDEGKAMIAAARRNKIS
ncbi:MAG TPA: acyl-CoA dehydrogenase family protein, partial [Phycicoccus sp.]|nr:acyl-CoA dehydrogenase family protein [Phycicoccus sp.]